MATANSITVKASTLELALVMAAGKLQVPQTELSYEIISESKAGGILSFFKKPSIEISAWPKTARESAPRNTSRDRDSARGERNNDQTSAPSRSNSARQQSKQHSRSQRDESPVTAAESKPLSKEELAALIEELRQYCQSICSMMLGAETGVSAYMEDHDRLVLNIENHEFLPMIQKDAKLAESLEHLLRKKPRQLKQEMPFRIFIDVDGLRKKRELELIQMANDLSLKVSESKRPIVLNYRSAYDRKIIHMALDQDDRVYTKSISNGANRKLMILPSKGYDSQSQAAEQNAIEHNIQ